MELSIIIPVYNVKEYLKRCVQSVVKQDFSDYEIILIDDMRKKVEKLIDQTNEDLETAQEDYNACLELERKYNSKIEQIKTSIVEAFPGDVSLPEKYLKESEKKVYDMNVARSTILKIDEFINILENENVKKTQAAR